VIPPAYQPRADIYWSNGLATVYVQTHRGFPRGLAGRRGHREAAMHPRRMEDG